MSEPRTGQSGEVPAVRRSEAPQRAQAGKVKAKLERIDKKGPQFTQLSKHQVETRLRWRGVGPVGDDEKPTWDDGIVNINSEAYHAETEKSEEKKRKTTLQMQNLLNDIDLLQHYKYNAAREAAVHPIGKGRCGMYKCEMTPCKAEDGLTCYQISSCFFVIFVFSAEQIANKGWVGFQKRCQARPSS